MSPTTMNLYKIKHVNNQALQEDTAVVPIRANSAITAFHGRYELIVLTYKVKPQYSPGKIQLKGSASFVDCRN